MKKLLLCFLVLVCANTSFAQYFTLSPTGFVSENKNEYLVIDAPGVKQDELYKNVLNVINTLYSNPQKGLHVVAGESINLSAYQKTAFKLSSGVMSYVYDVDYTLSFQFKEGKIRVNRPTFEAGFRNYNGTWAKLNPSRAFFKNNGEVKSEKNYNQVISSSMTLSKRF
jgi:hypothetical protein